MTSSTPPAAEAPDPPVDSPEFRALPPEERKRLRQLEKDRTDAQTEVHRKRKVARVRRQRLRAPFVAATTFVMRRTPLVIAALVGDLAGRVVYYVAGGWRRRVLAHLELALGGETTNSERRRIARRCLGLMGRCATSLVRLGGMGSERALAQVTVEGKEHMDEALADGKGVIMLSMHYGLFELVGIWQGVTYDGPVVGREGRGATQMLIDLRAELGGTTIERGDTRKLIRCLKRGLPVGLAADHDVPALNGVFVPFFGTLAHTAAGPARLAIRNGAPVVIGTAVWDGLTRHRVRWEPAIRPRADLSGDEAVLELTHRFTQVSERLIRERPEHWYWIHRRWVTRPEDRPELLVYDPSAADG